MVVRMPAPGTASNIELSLLPMQCSVVRAIFFSANHINSVVLQWLFTGLSRPRRDDVGERKMQDYREIDRIRKDTVAVHSLAKGLLNTPNHEWNDWELDFLEHMVRHRGPNPITTRQGEKLIELRDGAE